MTSGSYPPTPTSKVRTVASLGGAALLALALVFPAEAQRTARPRSQGAEGSVSRSAPRRAAPVSPRAAPARSTDRRAVPRTDVPRRGAPHRPTGNVGRRPGRHHGFFFPRHHRHHSSFHLGFGFGYPWFGYTPWYAYPHPYYGYYGYHGYYRPYRYAGPGYAAADYGAYHDREDLGAVALKIKPKSAQVFIDGRYIGVADSFDGFPRYLWLPPGLYDLVVYEKGYENLEAEIEVLPGQVLEFDTRLTEGAGARPDPAVPARRSERYERDYRPSRREPAPRAPARDLPGRDVRQEPAHLVLDVRPADASVYLDGRFLGTGRQVSSLRAPLIVDPGEHELEVIHPDRESQALAFTLERGEERTLEIYLD